MMLREFFLLSQIFQALQDVSMWKTMVSWVLILTGAGKANQ